MTEAPSDGPKKDPEKKRKVATMPPCPPSISTAYLLLRGALQGILGIDALETCTVSQFQGMYIKEQDTTGKFGITVNKVELLDLSNSEPGEALLNALEQAVNRLIEEGHSITCFSQSLQEFKDSYGPGVLDESHVGKKSKMKPNVSLLAAHVQDLVLAVPPSQPFASTSCIASIQLERGNMNSEVKVGKKNTQIMIKFKVVEGSGGDLALQAPAPSKDSLNVLQQTKIRIPEGRPLQKVEETVTPAETTIPVAIEEKTAEEDMVVTIENVMGKIDYDRLVKNFGSTLIDDRLMERLKAETVGKGRVPCLHRFLRRGMFFSHRDLDQLLKCVQAGTPMYLYTGRGPSSESMHLGHLIPFLFTKWLQDALDAPLVIQMTDDEKFIFKGNYDETTGDNLSEFQRLTMENAKDIIACEFDYNKTFIFSDLDYVGSMYPNIVRIWKAVTTNTVNGIFGFDGSSNTGKIAFPAVQAAPSFASSFPKVLQADRSSDHLCLIPCAIDQDPYFRMTRDVAHKLCHKKHGLGGKPALIHSKFFPPLQGAEGKMSSSEQNSAIFLTDTPEDIERKIKEHAFSGGQKNMKEQKARGANLEVDVAYQWLRFFLEDDDELEKIGKDYGTGSGDYWSTGAVKQRLIQVLQELVAAHQERRAKITDDDVRKWMQERSIV